MLDQMDFHTENKMKHESYHIPFLNLNVKVNTIKLIEKNTGEYFLGFETGKDFLKYKKH